MYGYPSRDETLSQGDIKDNCPVFGLQVTSQPVNVDADPVRWKTRVLVVTQACDLANVKTTRAVVAIVHTAQDLVDRQILKAKTIRDQIRRHQVFGWYFLPAHSEFGVPESIVDLRHLHTVPIQVMEQLAQEGPRVCRIETPYREHLAQHLATTYARIGLPEPYETSDQIDDLAH
jgi:hypothetical protein